MIALRVLLLKLFMINTKEYVNQPIFNFFFYALTYKNV